MFYGNSLDSCENMEYIIKYLFCRYIFEDDAYKLCMYICDIIGNTKNSTNMCNFIEMFMNSFSKCIIEFPLLNDIILCIKSKYNLKEIKNKIINNNVYVLKKINNALQYPIYLPLLVSMTQ